MQVRAGMLCHSYHDSPCTVLWHTLYTQ